MWDSIKNMCVDLNAKQEVEEEEDEEVKVMQNPCVGSIQRFHAYPGDEHKFIECQTWYSMQVC